MPTSDSLYTFPSNQQEALAMLYLQNQDLSGLTPAQLPISTTLFAMRSNNASQKFVQKSGKACTNYTCLYRILRYTLFIMLST